MVESGGEPIFPRDKKKRCLRVLTAYYNDENGGPLNLKLKTKVNSELQMGTDRDPFGRSAENTDTGFTGNRRTMMRTLEP